VQLSRAVARCDVASEKGLAVVGNGNIDVGNKTATPKPGGPKPQQAEVCGAMTQQRGDGGRGNESAPQKFVQLVGYRDPKARAEPQAGPRPAPVKR
jgi:hypothetical protein